MLTGRLPIRNGFYSNNSFGRNGKEYLSFTFFYYLKVVVNPFFQNCSLYTSKYGWRYLRWGDFATRSFERGWISHQTRRKMAPWTSNPISSIKSLFKILSLALYIWKRLRESEHNCSVSILFRKYLILNVRCTNLPMQLHFWMVPKLWFLGWNLKQVFLILILLKLLSEVPI